MSGPKPAIETPLSAYHTAQDQILSERHGPSTIPAFAQDNTELESFLAGDSVPASIPLVPQPTIFPQTMSSLYTEPVNLALDTDNILFHQQCLKVGQDIFPEQPESSLRREQPQHQSETTMQEHFDTDSGALQGTVIVFGAKQKFRSKLSPKARASTAQTRKSGACHRCHKMKKAVCA